MNRGFEELFVELNNIVETKRRQLELLTKEYAVLLKPWPSQKRGSSEDGEEKDANEGGSGKRVVPSEEQGELDLLEKFLNRAQKARDVQKKIDTKQSKDRKSGSRRLSEENVDNRQAEEQELAEEQEQTELEYGICSEENLTVVNKIRREVRNELLQGRTKPTENSHVDKTKKAYQNTVASQPKGPSHVNSTLHTKGTLHPENTSHSKRSQIRSASHGRNASHGEGVSHSGSSSHTRTASHGRCDTTSGASHCRNASHGEGVSHSGSSSHTRTASHGRCDTTSGASHCRNASHNMTHDRKRKERSSLLAAPKPPRPSSSRPYSAHVKAPFKTDPNVRVPKTSTTKAAMEVNKGRSTTRSGSVGTKPQSPKLTEHINNNMKTEITKLVHTKSTGINCDKPVGKNSETLDGNVASLPVLPPAENVKMFDDPHVEPPSWPVNPTAERVQTKDDARVKPPIKSVHPADGLANKMDGLHISGADVQEKLFTLQQDGAKIYIPSKFRRKVAANEKLREKVATQKVTKKVGSCDAKMEFLERLEHGFNPDSDLVTQTRVMSCLTAYQHLHQLLEGLKLSDITELSSTGSVLRAKMMMEYILASCDRLQHESETLVEAEYSAHLNKPLPVLQIDRETSLSQWMPHVYVTDVRLPCPSVITYRTGKEVQQYKHLVFQLQYLRLQSVVMEMAINKLLPVLLTLDPKSREFILMYRAVYAFLSSNEAQHLPGIVQESM
ncbi:uncharacterized protein LOC124139429 isoform X1 [Haliotis rufescens]|uniref:uncharacterized protein LOC124139429 isoform X1 n=1 Tax=Haliotis rufescens TaxID=6454 RepID=UPI00201E7548|nr:uncharacterized protein LOC124139429 isoform X1 [Haliotis rufescens]